MDTDSEQLDSPMHYHDQVDDSSSKRNNTSQSQDPAKKRDKKKSKRQSKEVVRERKRAKVNVATVEEERSVVEATDAIATTTIQSSEIDVTLKEDQAQAGQEPTIATSSLSTSSSSSTEPKVLPRIAISTSLLPRILVPHQLSRPRPSTKPKPGSLRTIVAMTPPSVPKEPSTSVMPTLKDAIPTESTKVEASAGQPIFRARDIRAKAAAVDAAAAASAERMSTSTSTSSSRQQPPRPHNNYSKSYSDTQNSRTPSQRSQYNNQHGSSREAEEGNVATAGSGLIRAKPIMVTVDGKFEFPYGNYPSYYEKRSREQKKQPSTEQTEDSSSSATGIPERILHSPYIVMGTNSSGMDTDTGSAGQHQRQIQHFRNATPSVLFPAPRSTFPSITGNNDNDQKKREDTRFSIQALAKSVDLRLEFLQGSWFRGKKVLDIGCNSGLLTVFIAMHYRPMKIEGVDVDPSLIGKAQNFVLKTFSQISRQAYLQEPESSSLEEGGSSSGSNNSSNNSDPVVPYQSYFPKALQRMHGSLPIPAKTEKTQHLFPHNIELRITDWVSEGDDSGKDPIDNDAGATSSTLSTTQQYDVIIGFSLTKWIHLQHGDDGLKKFFKKVYQSLTPEGIFLMEPQAHSTYKKRSKITKKMEENYKSIKFVPKKFEEYLLSPEVGFREVQLLGQSQGSAQNFNRPIYLFRK